MAQKVIRRTIKDRGTARPGRSKVVVASGGFFGMLARLNDASARLERARPRRW
jgi:hypothetical protein